MRNSLKILKVYGQATCQVVSSAKSSITFGGKVDDQTKDHIQRITEIFGEGGACKYLRLSEYFSGSKRDLLGFIQDKLKHMLTGWFDLGGKEVLLKIVAMALHVYAMSCFKLPIYTCENITKAMANFWWNSLEHKKIRVA